uniref:Retrovirus-related Pol polyprotein from transposon TNT 1-94 n=1 Tax=Cajanus cajan TaxID=3821 RepID=A0A151SEG5_CAJCA|nr:Retrovirus-related Pol polyprotein from transposon TNT 1-94 [Cajanus cajan]
MFMRMIVADSIKTTLPKTDGCWAEIRIYNPQEKKLDARTISGYFIGYPEKSKGYMFYCPNHSIRLFETGNARFIENGEVSGSTIQQKVEVKEVRMQVPLTYASGNKVSVPLTIVSNNNEEEQHNNELMIHNEPIVEQPQEITLRRSQRKKKTSYFKKSTIGYVFLLVGGAISWKSVKQTIVASSIMEAKFVACFEATIQTNWLQNFISGLGIVDSIAKPLKM